MNPRERLLALGVLAVVVLAGGAVLFQQLFWTPLGERVAEIQSTQEKIKEAEERIRQINAEKPKLERWRQLSLPPDLDTAGREYEKYLRDLMRDSGFAADSVTVTPHLPPPDTKNPTQIAGKVPPVFTKLDFQVGGTASLAAIVNMLEKFYGTGLLHQVKRLTIRRPSGAPTRLQQQGELFIDMSVQALIVNGAESRSYLLGINRRLLAIDVFNALRGGPTGLALVPWVLGPTGPLGPGVLAQPARNYAAIASKNIFLGNPPPQRNIVVQKDPAVDPTPFVYLSSIYIEHEPQHSGAFFWDQYNDREIWLRLQPGSDTFRLQKEDGELIVQGQVVHIDARDIVFRTDDNYYSMHLGWSLQEALRAPLSDTQVKALGLVLIQEKTNGGQ